MKKVTLVVIVFVVIVGAIFWSVNKNIDKSKKENDYLEQMAQQYGFGHDINGFANSLYGREIYVKNKKVIIDNKETCLISDKRISQKQVFIADVLIDKNQLHIKCTDGSDIKVCEVDDNTKKHISLLKNVSQGDNNEKNKCTAFIKVENTNLKDKKSLNIPIMIENNPGILGMTLRINYNEKKLKLFDIQEGDALKGQLVFTKPAIYFSGCKLLWDGVKASKKNDKKSILAVLKFDIIDDKDVGTITASYIKGDIVDDKLNPILVGIYSGIIK